MSTLWRCNWSERVANNITQWRYCELGRGEMVLAFDGDRPIGMIASYTRPYLIDNTLVWVREPADWYCLPEYRHFGVGVRLMNKLMDEPEPIFAIGANEDVRPLLGALGWWRLPDVKDYTLPVSTKWLAKKLWRSLRLPPFGARATRLFEASSPLWPRVRPRRRRTRSSQYLAAPEARLAMTPAAGQYELTPLIRERELEWLYAAPKEMGSFCCLVFPEARTEGFSLGRLYSYENASYFKLIHIQTSNPSVEVYADMLAETVRFACDQGADVIQFRASCPFLQRALEGLGFVWSSLSPSYWWPKNGNVPDGKLHMTFLRGDDGIRPYPNQDSTETFRL
jgi:Acetyltransferase (GNAT) family